MNFFAGNPSLPIAIFVDLNDCTIGNQENNSQEIVDMKTMSEPLISPYFQLNNLSKIKFTK